MSKLLEFCNTSHQSRIVEAVLQIGGEEAALSDEDWVSISQSLGVTNTSNVRQAFKRVRRRATDAGYIPDHGLIHPLPQGVDLERATIQRDGAGNIERTWTKAKSQKEKQIECLIEKMDNDLPFKPFKPTPAPKNSDKDLATLVTITDFHLGMYAWEAETGDDWDVEIARTVFLNAIHDMCQASPKSGLGILNQLGDFLHFDGLLAVTPTSKHVLDADTRYSKLVDLTMDVMTEAVRIMLKRFDNVHVVQAEGNHDEQGSIWLRKFMKHMYHNDDRVTVDDTVYPYYGHLFGDTMLAFHHGHKTKAKDLPKLFSSDPRYRATWGQAKQTYIHTGHLHHEKVIEDGGAIVEQHPTLSGRDAYAARGGWVSMRGAKTITYHKQHGELSRHTVRPRI